MNPKLFLGTALAAAAVVIGGIATLQIPTVAPSDDLLQESLPVEFVEERQYPQIPGSPPSYFDMKYDHDDFDWKGGASNLELRVDQGVTRYVRVEITPTKHLKGPAVFQVGEPELFPGGDSGRVEGVKVSFSPNEFLVTPGETVSFTIAVAVESDAPNKVYFFQYGIRSEAFGGRRSSSFEILVGNASGIPRDMPLVEDIKQIGEDELEAYLADGWQVYRELGDGEYLVKRLERANP